MKCDTCGKEMEEVKRVVIRQDYDRTLSRPLYNCPECYAKKLASARVSKTED